MILIHNRQNVHMIFQPKNFCFILDETDWFIGSKILQNPKKNFPIIFKSVNGFCKRSENDVR